MNRASAVGALFVLCGVLSAPPATAGEGEAAPSLPVRLTLDDGSTHVVLGPIDIRDDKVLFRLPGGRLASLPVRRVEGMTPLPPPPPAEPRPVEGSRGSETGDLGRFTNEDLPPPLESSRTIPPGGDREASDAAGTEVAVGYEDYRDRDGRGESWWRERAATIDRDLADAKKEMEDAYAELHSLTREYGAGTTGGRLLYAIQKARERFETAEKRWRDLAARRSSLEDDARRAGALPGWLR